MLHKWLACRKREPSGYKFAVVDVTETSAPNGEVLSHLARELVCALGSPEMIKRECQILLEDAGTAKLDILKRYVEQEILPDRDRASTSVSFWGEVLSARLLVELEGFRLPIQKLRFREKRNWAMRLTDLCVIKDGLPRPLVCYGEVKTKSSGCDKKLGVTGHNSLAKDDALADPEILHFMCVWLYETGRFEDGEFLSRIRLGKRDYDKRHDLFLVHDSGNWTEEILGNLDNCDLDERLVDFSVKVVRIADLRRVIDTAYERIWEELEEATHG